MENRRQGWEHTQNTKAQMDEEKKRLILFAAYRLRYGVTTGGSPAMVQAATWILDFLKEQDNGENIPLIMEALLSDDIPNRAYYKAP